LFNDFYNKEEDRVLNHKT